MHNYRELNIWKRPIKIAVEVYKVSAVFPSSERYEITSQVKRAVVSVASNIAEGAGRNTDKEFNHFLGIAIGSSFEVYTQLVIAGELGLIKIEILEPLLTELEEIQKMIRGFKEKLNINN